MFKHMAYYLYLWF